MLRVFAALMLALVVPVQAGAAVCAHLCAASAFGQDEAVVGDESAQHVAASHADATDDVMHGHHCGKSDAPGKCCQGHSAMTHVGVQSATVSIPGFESAAFVARWTNFIPEEASPPPIAC